jgi:hypothetical protein
MQEPLLPNIEQIYKSSIINNFVNMIDIEQTGFSKSFLQKHTIQVSYDSYDPYDPYSHVAMYKQIFNLLETSFINYLNETKVTHLRINSQYLKMPEFSNNIRHQLKLTHAKKINILEIIERICKECNDINYLNLIVSSDIFFCLNQAFNSNLILLNDNCNRIIYKITVSKDVLNTSRDVSIYCDRQSRMKILAFNTIMFIYNKNFDFYKNFNNFMRFYILCQIDLNFTMLNRRPIAFVKNITLNT